MVIHKIHSKLQINLAMCNLEEYCKNYNLGKLQICTTFVVVPSVLLMS